MSESSVPFGGSSLVRSRNSPPAVVYSSPLARSHAARGRLRRRLRRDLALGVIASRSCSPGTLKSMTSVPK